MTKLTSSREAYKVTLSLQGGLLSGGLLYKENDYKKTIIMIYWPFVWLINI